MVLAIPQTEKGAVPWENMLTDLDCPVIYLDGKMNTQDKCSTMDILLEKHSIDLIHIHFGMWLTIFWKYRNRWPKVKILVHDHMDYGVDVLMQKQIVMQWIRGGIYRLKGIGVISVMKRKSRGYFLCGKKNWYVPNAISFTRNVEQSLSREQIRKNLGIAENEKWCMLLGWDMKRKGIDVAVKAVQQCRLQGENVILGIVGLGENPSVQSKQEILINTGISPEEPWIRYFPSTEDMYSYHRAADVYLSASRKEAFSYGILEAISQNIPAAVSDIPGTQWAGKYSKCKLFANEDVQECTQAILACLQLGMVDSNYEQITEEHHVENWCKEITEKYMLMMK